MQQDKFLHSIVGALLGLLAMWGFWGYMVGSAVIIGWELCQYVFDTGTFELADIFYGQLFFTIGYFLVYFIARNKNRR